MTPLKEKTNPLFYVSLKPVNKIFQTALTGT